MGTCCVIYVVYKGDEDPEDAVVAVVAANRTVAERWMDEHKSEYAACWYYAGIKFLS